MPQAAAPKLVEPEPVPEPPKPEPKPEPKVQQPSPEELQAERDAEIAIAKAKEKKKLEAERQRLAELEAERKKQLTLKEKEKLEREREKQLQAKREAEDKFKKEKLDKQLKDKQAKAEEAKREAKLEAQRQENLRRIQGMAGASGGPSATGTALKSSGPSASYGGRIKARIRPNIIYTDMPAGNPVAEVEVRTLPSGQIVASKLLKSSGDAEWDKAVLRAIDKTETLPRDTDGRVPPVLVISFQPRE